MTSNHQSRKIEDAQQVDHSLRRFSCEPTFLESSEDNLDTSSTSTTNIISQSGDAHANHNRARAQTFESSIMRVKSRKANTWSSFPRRGYETTTTYFYQEVDSSWTVVMLVACFFVSGLLDSVAFGVWGVFTAMQTGNTIFLAVRVSSPLQTQHSLNYVKSLVSIGSYCFGALIFNCLHKAPIGLSESRAPLARWTLTCSFLLQATLIVTVAILAQLDVISKESRGCGSFSSGTTNNPGDHFLDLLGIGILALESAGQVCLSRVLLVNELPTIVLTTSYHDLIGESLSTRRCWRESETGWNFLVSQKKQIRRVACIVSLFGGALIGGFVFSSSRAGFAAALWLAAGIKILICVAWCLWKRKDVTDVVT